MNTQMIINRTDNWFIHDNVQADPYYMSILLLERLSTRLKKGYKYDRLKLIKELTNQKSVNALKILDQAIMLLSSRSLIQIKTDYKKFESTILITEEGLRAYKEFRRDYKNVF
jgi:hypothetical protein